VRPRERQGERFFETRSRRIDDQNWPEYARVSMEAQVWREQYKPNQQLTLPQLYAEVVKCCPATEASFGIHPGKADGKVYRFNF
jgi:hypothetical protein